MVERQCLRKNRPIPQLKMLEEKEKQKQLVAPKDSALILAKLFCDETSPWQSLQLQNLFHAVTALVI